MKNDFFVGLVQFALTMVYWSFGRLMRLSLIL